jgi:hypothetical protein
MDRFGDEVITPPIDAAGAFQEHLCLPGIRRSVCILLESLPSSLLT